MINLLITIDDEAIDPGVHRVKVYPATKKVNPLITIDDEAISSAATRPMWKQVAWWTQPK